MAGGMLVAFMNRVRCRSVAYAEDWVLFPGYEAHSSDHGQELEEAGQAGQVAGLEGER